MSHLVELQYPVPRRQGQTPLLTASHTVPPKSFLPTLGVLWSVLETHRDLNVWSLVALDCC